MTPLATADAPPLDLARVRALFPALSTGAAFLDGPGGTQVPAPVISAMAGYLERSNANVGGFFETSVRSGEVVAQARDAAAEFLGADRDEVVFGPSMTALNLTLTRSLARELRPGDEVVATQLDHDANVAPWLHLAEERGIVVRLARMADDFTLDLDDLTRKVGPRTRVVAFPLASNALGTTVDAPAVVGLARSLGALVWVDAVHWAPHGPVDLRALDADVVLCSPYKFFGPHLGLAAVRRDLLERLHAYKVRPAPERPLGHRFEAGTLPHESLAGLTAALAYLRELGWPAIRAHESELGRRFLDGLERLEHVTLRGRPTMEGRVPTFALTSTRETPHAAAARLARRGIHVWSGDFYALEVVRRLGLEEGGLLRAGFVHYNTVEDVDRLLAAL